MYVKVQGTGSIPGIIDYSLLIIHKFLAIISIQ